MDRPVLKTLIVDDEPIARQVLREDLEQLPDVEVVGEAENGKQALQQIEQLTPDLVLLDLQMPVMGGFEVVRNLTGKQAPVVVIVTAFDQHAIQAFEDGAVDYLLKPVNESRLRTAVERARNMRGRPLEIANEVARIVAATDAPHPSQRRKVVGRNGADYFPLDADDILTFRAERELVWIVTAKHRLLATQTLQAIQERLCGGQFQRVHRNTIVNVNHVRTISAISSQRWLITLSNSLQIIVSKRQAHQIRKILRW
jgi:two-component system, LytTR family, response regulator